MSNMTKYVRVRTQVAVRNVNPPICGTYEGIMTTGDILKCICKRAIVHEILPDGKTVRLNMSNYYIDNGAGLNAEVHHPVEKKVVENPSRFKVPDVPKTSVVETKTDDNANSNDSVNVADLNMPATEEVVNAVPENDTVVNETTPVSESETVEAADTSNTEESVETTENSNVEETESVEETADTSNTETATSQNNHNNYQYYNKKNKKNR